MTDADKRKTFEQMLGNELERAKIHLEKFIEDISTDPHYAFDWAEHAMEASAWSRVGGDVADKLSTGSSLGAIKDGLLEDLLLHTKNPKQSTPCSNRLAEYRTAARAQMVDWLLALERAQ